MFEKFWITIYKPETDTIITESKFYYTVLGARRGAAKFVDYIRPGYIVAICKMDKKTNRQAIVEIYCKKLKYFDLNY